MAKWIYYHNPRCSKSRQGLDLLEKQGVSLEIKKYLESPLSIKELDEIFKGLDKAPEEVIRKKEAAFIEHKQEVASFNREQWLNYIQENPILLERPILKGEKKVAIGRPPEDLLKIL
jgi:arsenate reductase (glutaredoxin)